MLMQRCFSPIVFAVALALPLCAPAQGNTVLLAQAKAAAPNVAWSEGVVKSVNRQQGEITIAHGPLVNLGMGKMTMTFRLKTPALIEGIKEGSRIRFVAEDVKGELTVVALEAAK